MDSLKETNLGQAYNIMKKLDAKPGEWDQNKSFTRPHMKTSVCQMQQKKLQNICQRIFPPQCGKPARQGVPKIEQP